MKISVIVPVYNVEEYLNDCVESVLQQTHQDFELVLVDDGSSDASGAICDQYSNSYSEQIKTIHLQNGGPLRARLFGIQNAVGEVIVFLDSDDCLRKDALEKISKQFFDKNCDMVLYNAECCERFSSISVVHTIKDGQVFEECSKSELYKKILCGDIPNALWLKAVRAECAYYPEHFMDFSMKHGEDFLLSACLITNCNKIVYLNEGLYHYRNRPGSAVHSFNPQRKESIKAVHAELEKYIDIWEMPELKPIHNARKVKGWVENVKMFIRCRKSMSNLEFKKEFRDMSQDPYFVSAYKNMDKSQLSLAYRAFARLLYGKRYYLLLLACYVMKVLKK